MLRVGLTGGIGVGKTVACNTFLSLGVPVVDADKIARELSTFSKPVLREIRDAFGDEILDPEGVPRRDKLRRIVFSDGKKRKQLERILHPAIKKKLRDTMASLQTPYCVACIPLLIESNMLDLVDVVVVIDCPKPIQVKRARERDQLEEEEILKIIAVQAPKEERLAKADIVIDSSGDEAMLRKRVKALHQNFMQKTQLPRA